MWFQKNQKVKSLGVITVIILIVFGVGTTYAYNLHNAQQENLLRASKVAGEIIENEEYVGEESQFVLANDGVSEKRVQFKNIGEAAVFLRVSFGETWLSDEGEWLAGDNEYATLNWTEEWMEEWQLGDDNWYYYEKILEPNTLTDEVLTAVEFESLGNLPVEYQNASYQLFFTMEVVQFSDDMEVNSKALEETFGRSAIVDNDAVIWE